MFPAAGEPIPAGVVTLCGERITAVGRQPASPAVEDLGNVAILPGLLNAHTHLDLSHLGAPLGEPGGDFVDWIRRVLESRTPGAAPGAVGRGLRESLRLGTTALADIAQPDWPREELRPPGPDVTVCLELIAPTRQRMPAALRLAREHLEAARSGVWRPGLSPHAPYSVHWRLWSRLVGLSAQRRVPLAVHLAESREEIELLQSAGGTLRRLLEERDAWQPGAVPSGSRPLDYLRALAAAHRVLVVHGNYLDDREIAFLARRAARMTVVYCPRTHAFFRHPSYPLRKMLSAGVRVALGTDSRASSPDLSLLAEMRHVARSHPDLPGEQVLQLATIRGAAALGLDRQMGTLEPGKLANLTAVALPDQEADPYRLLLQGDGPVVATWCRGRRHGGA